MLLSANEILVWHKWYVWVSQLFGPEFDSYVMCMKKYLMENVSTIDELPRGNKTIYAVAREEYIWFLKNNINTVYKKSIAITLIFLI